VNLHSFFSPWQSYHLARRAAEKSAVKAMSTCQSKLDYWKWPVDRNGIVSGSSDSLVRHRPGSKEPSNGRLEPRGIGTLLLSITVASSAYRRRNPCQGVDFANAEVDTPSIGDAATGH
jgi:hypothetical protein